MLNINHIRIFGAPDTLTVSYGGVIASRLIYTDRFAYPFVIGGGKIIIGGSMEIGYSSSTKLLNLLIKR